MFCNAIQALSLLVYLVQPTVYFSLDIIWKGIINLVQEHKIRGRSSSEIERNRNGASSGQEVWLHSPREKLCSTHDMDALTDRYHTEAAAFGIRNPVTTRKLYYKQV